MKGALSESESFSNSEMAYWKSDGYTNFGKVVVVAVVVGGGGRGDVKAAPIACLTFTFTRGPPFIQNKISFRPSILSASR